MPKIFDTTPSHNDLQVVSDLGTLEQRVKQKNKLEVKQQRKSKFDSFRERVEQTTLSDRSLSTVIEQDSNSVPKCMEDVDNFSKLIDDHVVLFDQLSCGLDPDGSFRIVCANPPSPTGTVSDASDALHMRPSSSFLTSVARYANGKTHCRGLTGSFLNSMRNNNESKPILVQLLNHFFKQLAVSHRTRGKNDVSAKEVKLRTLRPDKDGKWAKQRVARAILAKDYRDDISHQWVIQKLATLVPTANIIRYYFNGDLMKGAALIPTVARVEKDSEYGGGIFFFSGEVGNRRAGVQPFLFRAVSGGITIVGQPWGVAHKGKADLSKLGVELEDYVNKQIPLVSKHIDSLLKLQELQFSTDDRFAVERVLIALRSLFPYMTQQDIKLWRVGADAERNLFPNMPLSVFTLQNGITRMTQATEDIVRQIHLEQAAGKLLTLNWESIAARAKTVSDNQVEQLFF